MRINKPHTQMKNEERICPSCGNVEERCINQRSKSILCYQCGAKIPPTFTWSVAVAEGEKGDKWLRIQAGFGDNPKEMVDFPLNEYFDLRRVAEAILSECDI